jgi:hypothetical protein
LGEAENRTSRNHILLQRVHKKIKKQMKVGRRNIGR